MDSQYEFIDQEYGFTFAGSGFTSQYNIAAACIYIFYNPDAEPDPEYKEYTEEYYEAEDEEINNPDMLVFVQIYLTIPLELKSEIVNRIIERYGKSKDMNYLQWSIQGIATYITSGEDEAFIKDFFKISCGLEGL